MSKLLAFLKGTTGRVTTLLVLIVSVSILITATLGYFKLYQVTAANSSIRIDRAARAATALFAERLASEFTVIRDEAGTPLALRLKGEDPTEALTFRDAHDALLKEIGGHQSGRRQPVQVQSSSPRRFRPIRDDIPQTGRVDAAADVDRGIMHPAYDDLDQRTGRIWAKCRLWGACDWPILHRSRPATGNVEGALAVDVGWVDDLVAAKNELRRQIIIATGLILALVAAFGAASLGAELKPLRALSRYAEDLAAGAPAGTVPYRERNDEIGALAQGLERVVALQGKLAHLAYTDPLTGLANRSRHLNDLDQALSESLSGQRKWTLLHIDLDKFKQVNDGYGQSVGDRVIKLIAARLKDTAGDSARIARLAADHFAVLIGDGRSADEVETLAEKLLTEIHEPLQLNAGEIRLTGSIGIVLLQHDASDADEAHRNAGLALRKAKAKGDRAVFFSSEMLDDFQNHMRIERMLRLAIADRAIEVHFQPQVNPATHQLAGVEALARWTHPSEGPISPAMFIPIAEASGQIVDLGTLILELACEQAAKWRTSGFAFRHISINVSPIQLWQPNFIEVVKDALKRHDLAGNEICIEITEGVFVDQSKQRIEKVLAALRQLGVLLSLDDFGSGYSSLGYLNRLPFDQLKVDRSFVSDIDTDVRKQKVMRGILELGRGLGFDIVVEGAETLEEVSVIRDMGCDAIQGYYYSRPAPALLIPEVVKKIQRLKPSEEARTA
jgi:diguanylate cyclase (GGDEF)-like protein